MGHRGLPSARLFTDLEQMVEGDTFTINIMDETITYMVDQICIVLPEEVDDLAIQAGRDYCTLVTCTSYGINTHRMLSGGRVFLSLFGMLIYYRVRKPAKSREEILEELKKGNRES